MLKIGSGLNVSDPTVISAFNSALVRQGIIALLIFAMVWLAWITGRARLPGVAQASDPAGAAHAAASAAAEPAWRKLLRVGFGLLWVFDGILQAQPKMVLGLPSQVIGPVAERSPHWVQQVVTWGGTTWSDHPVEAAASAVWIQVGIGIWMLAASRGPLSRLAGLASVGWGLVVWVFGECFGGIFVPGLSWLSGAPGAVLIYVVAGGLIALPERAWHGPRLGRAICAGTGLFLLGMAVLQAWPGRGFWQGTLHGQPGSLASVARDMAQTPQPGLLSGWVDAVAGFVQAHGFAVNLFAVVALAVIGAAFLTGRRRLVRPAVIAFAVVCLADWVLVEDFGFFGGVGTDPNSMIPFVLLAGGGYLALARVPVPTAEPAKADAAPAAGATGKRPDPVWVQWREWAHLATLRQWATAASIRSVVAIGALGLLILGTVPLVAAWASPSADSILVQAARSDTVCELMQGPPDAGLNRALQTAVAVARARTDVTTVVRTASKPDIGPFLTSHCALILADGYQQAPAVVTAASRYPRQRFLQADYWFNFNAAPELTRPNMSVLAFEAGQAAFLAGYLAAAVSPNHVVAEYGSINTPTVDLALNGFLAGALAWSEDSHQPVRVLGWNGSSGPWVGNDFDEHAAASITSRMIRGGAHVIFGVAGQAVVGSARAAAGHPSTYVIGMYTDGYQMAPQYAGTWLTSVIFNMRAPVLRAIQAATHGRFSGGLYTGTLANGGVGLAPFHRLAPLVPKALLTRLQVLKAGLGQGWISLNPADYVPQMMPGM